mmetsp:Transcript_39072/g.102937  ORF Transcript_39072/g.102937 Transcript_39072/m.102937 type:complete len:121 (+) Transcript_39072:31-393(+)
MSGHTGIDAERDKDHPYGNMYKDHNPGSQVHKPPMPTVDACQSVEEQIARLEAVPANQKLLRQIGVRESLFRCLAARTRFDATEEMKDQRVLALVSYMMGMEMDTSPGKAPMLIEPMRYS